MMPRTSLNGNSLAERRVCCIAKTPDLPSFGPQCHPQHNLLKSAFAMLVLVAFAPLLVAFAPSPLLGGGTVWGVGALSRTTGARFSPTIAARSLKGPNENVMPLPAPFGSSCSGEGACVAADSAFFSQSGSLPLASLTGGISPTSTLLFMRLLWHIRVAFW